MASPVIGDTVTAAARAVNATKVYGWGDTAVVALNDVTVTMPTGRFTAVMGPSGSGKSTLMHCMAGLDDLTEGEVFDRRAQSSPASPTRSSPGCGATTSASCSRRSTWCRRSPRPRTSRSRPTSRAASPTRSGSTAWSTTTGLADRLRHRPSELSGGQQQRVAVARALAGKPDIIFADEPTGNLDSRSGAEILGFMSRAVDELGQTIVMVTHDPVAAGYADDAVFLERRPHRRRDGRPHGREGARPHEAVRRGLSRCARSPSAASSNTRAGSSPRSWPWPSAWPSWAACSCSPTP